MSTIEKTWSNQLKDLHDQQLAAFVSLIDGFDDEQLQILANEVNRRLEARNIIAHTLHRQTKSEMQSIVEWLSNAMDLRTRSRELNVQR